MKIQVVILLIVLQQQLVYCQRTSVFLNIKEAAEHTRSKLNFKPRLIITSLDNATGNVTDEEYLQKLRAVDNAARWKSIKQKKIELANKERKKSYVALCTIARDEHAFIREWVTYHKYIGVNKIYIYDHMSIPSMQPILEDFIKSGIVDYTSLNLQWLNDDYNLDARPVNYKDSIHSNSPQRWAHMDCFMKHGKKHQFMAMVDIDEFIVLNLGHKGKYIPRPKPDLGTFLVKYEDTGGVYMQWRIFGSSGHVERPEGLVLKNYVQCETQVRQARPHDAKSIKHLVNMKYFLDMCIIHTCFTSASSVNPEFHEYKPNHYIHADWEGIQLNHYMFKSKEDFQHKRNRGGGHMNPTLYKMRRSIDIFNQIDTRIHGQCTTMADLANACCT